MKLLATNRLQLTEDIHINLILNGIWQTAAADRDLRVNLKKAIQDISEYFNTNQTTGNLVNLFEFTEDLIDKFYRQLIDRDCQDLVLISEGTFTVANNYIR